MPAATLFYATLPGGAEEIGPYLRFAYYCDPIRNNICHSERTLLARGICRFLTSKQLQIPRFARNDNLVEASQYSASLNNILQVSISACCPALAALLHNVLHLLQMVQVVAGKQAHQMRNGFFPALLVHAVVFPKIPAHGFQQR